MLILLATSGHFATSQQRAVRGSQHGFKIDNRIGFRFELEEGLGLVGWGG